MKIFLQFQIVQIHPQYPMEGLKEIHPIAIQKLLHTCAKQTMRLLVWIQTDVKVRWITIGLWQALIYQVVFEVSMWYHMNIL